MSDEDKIIRDRDSWPRVDSSGGDLVEVEVRPGVSVRMRRADAERAGLLQEKAQRKPNDKERRPKEDK